MTTVLYLGCPQAERPDVERALATAQVAIRWADSVSGALAELQRRDLPVLIDLSRGAAALETARDVRTQRASTLTFAIVDPRRPDLATEAVLAGMADVFTRPLTGRRVVNAVERELGYESRAQMGRSRAPTPQDLYGHSAAMREVIDQIDRAAGLRSGVIIRGEEGSGRQVAARSIHAAGPSPRAAFLVVDCASFDAPQLELELFGRASRSRDSDTGPERLSRDSMLFSAHGGTLYLRQVGEAATRIQARLARLLRDREAVLIETGETLDVDVRLMAGADPGFENLLQEGRLREDLHRRLAMARIDMPPLRNRREDIPALANFLVREICAELGVPPKTLSRPALSLIGALPWRGNATELRAVLDSVVTGLAGGRGIALEDVLAHVRLDGGAAVFANGGATLRQARARFEREYIAAVVDQHRGRITDAAKALGIQRTNLYRKMRALRVSRSRRTP